MVFSLRPISVFIWHIFSLVYLFYVNRILMTQIILNWILIKREKTPTKSRTTENKYSLKAVKIAYFLLREYINEQNYKEILKRHTTYTSNKILQNPIIKSLQLTALIEDKTAAEKHLKTLKEAEQLLNSGQMVTNGNKIKEALKALSQIISTFSSNKDTYYN